jgi:hypothetical protein
MVYTDVFCRVFLVTLGATQFYGKMGQKYFIVDFLLLSFNSKLSHFDKNINLNLNLNHTCLSPTWRKPIWSLIYGEHSELIRQIQGKKLPQRILHNARTLVNVAQHVRDFGHCKMNKRNLGRQREDRILVAEEDIPHGIQERHFQQSFFN